MRRRGEKMEKDNKVGNGFHRETIIGNFSVYGRR